MVESCLMASHGYPIVGFNQEHGSGRVSDDFHQIRPYHGSNQDSINSLSFNLSVQQKEEWRSNGGLLETNHFVRTDLTCKQTPVSDFQDTRPGSVVFGFRIVERCARHEKFLKLLALGSIEEDNRLVDLSMLCNLMGPQSLTADFPQWCFDGTQTLQNLVYPTKELYLYEPFLDLVGDGSSCPERPYDPNGRLPYSCIGTEMNDMLSVISNFRSSRKTNKYSRQTMLVPYFERRRRARTKTNASKLAYEKVNALKTCDKAKEKASQKKKTRSTKTSSKERDAYSNSYLYACESLLSIIANRKQHDKNSYRLFKKSAPHLPRLLTQFSASIAGIGIAVVLSVLCSLTCTRVPFCTSKLLSAGVGLGLVWLSWAVNRLRDTVLSISKTSVRFGEKEEEMMNRLDRSLKDIFFRAIALMAVVVLKVA